MSENKYREYLSDNPTFYRQYLKNEDEPVGSSFFAKAVTGTVAAVGLAAGTAAAYRKGAFRGATEKIIDTLGQFRRTRLGDSLNSVRNWTKDDMWDDIAPLKGLDKLSARVLMAEKLPEYMFRGGASRTARQLQHANNPIIQDKEFELTNYLKQMSKVSRTHDRQIKAAADELNFTRAQQLNEYKNATQGLMDDAMANVLRFNKEQQDNLLRSTGYQQATVKDVYHHLPIEMKEFLTHTEKSLADRQANYSIMDKVIDQNVLVKKGDKGQPVFADLRDFRDAIAKTGDSIAEDFTTPFIKINPFRMFYLNEFTKHETPTLFADLASSKVQPFIKNGLPSNDRLFVNGRVHAYNYDTKQFDVSENAGYLVNAGNEGSGSLLARNTKNMMNLYEGKMSFTQSDGNKFLGGDIGFRRNVWEPLARKLDFGFQNERIGQDPTLGDVAVYGSWIGKKLHDGFLGWKGIKPYQDRIHSAPVFGEGAEHLFIPRYKTLKELNEEGKGSSAYFKQFYAARNNPEDVTTASFFAYTMSERLNATINQMGFGLNAKHLGSAQQVMWQLSLRRALPVAGVIEGYKALNHAGEVVLGDEPEDLAARGFIGAQMDLAKVAEFTGFTDAMKDMKKIMPGMEFIAELPIPVLTTEGMTPMRIGDILPLDKTKEELVEYYQNGEEAVRKGRYWETGNTPLTGGKVDYYQPNWFRRITSDWEYTENMWGSKAEYWAFHPKAPILNPYHWEKKHYEDRPYQLTGGIPMIEEFPLIGPALNATIGQLLKPQQVMHQEEWNNPGYYSKQQGFQLAEALGILESTMGGSGEGGILSAHTGSAAGHAGGNLTQASRITQAASQTNSMYRSKGVEGYVSQGSYAVQDGDHLAYVTSSGNVSVMNVDKQANLFDINQTLQNAGIGKTGAASIIRMEYPELTDNEAETLANPAGVNMALGNMHYNATELGGFYGWMSTFVTGRQAGEHDPKIQTSSKAYGFNRQFWDSDYGNMGADAMEIFRRFVPRDAHKNYVNTIDNNMPTWMPGEEYFTNYQQGDPYVKIKKGEMRLPGEAYERLYGIDGDKAMELNIGGSFIGYDVKTIIDHWLNRDTVKDEKFQDILDAGTQMHKEKEKYFAENGVAVSTEMFVEDEGNKINGYYDMEVDNQALLAWGAENNADMQYYRAGAGGGDNAYEGYYQEAVDVDNKVAAEIVSKSERGTSDIKTRGQNPYDKNALQFENAQQLNFYAMQMGTGVNSIVEFNRDDPGARPQIHFFDTNEDLYKYTTDKVTVAREAVKKMLDDGAIGRGDLYDTLDKYRILADTAPYSDEFRKLKGQLSLMNLNDEQKAEIQLINKQLATRKDHVRTYDYHFKTANVKNMKVTIDKVIDNNTFLTKEYGDNPISLAGVYVPMGKDEKGVAATDFIRRYLKEGRRLTISINGDEENQIKNDTYKTISAVVRAGDIGNINREMINKGLAKEKENDWSATGVHARFSPGQIQFGSAWESFAHMDTPIHTKLLQVRSPLEQYTRREVYGKNWQDWGDPIGDFAIPWYQSWINKSPIAAVTFGTVIGSLFGGSPFGKVMGALIGGTASALGVTYVGALEAVTGENWVPERRRKEREIEEYFDTLKYVKYRSLYEQAADESIKRDGFDVRAYVNRNKMSGDVRKSRLHELRKEKRDLMRRTGSKKSERMSELNAEINDLVNERKAQKIPGIAADAIMYYQEAEKTMYAYDPGDPLANSLAALPRKERLYINKFLDAPEEERDEILEVVPDYVKRVLQSAWGKDVDEKKDLYEYFSKHNLPNEKWAGWDPRANLSDIKLRVVKHEGMEMGEFNFWPEDEARAEKIQDNQVPTMLQDTHIGAVKNRLRTILGDAGFRQLNVEVLASKEPGVQMDFDIAKDRRSEITEQLNSNGYSLVE